MLFFFQRAGNVFFTLSEEYSANEIFSMVHPLQMTRTLEENGKFREMIQTIDDALQHTKNTLITKEEATQILIQIFDEDQLKWLNDNIFKFTFAAIAYEEIRSELVHDMSVFNLTFSETIYRGQKVPDLNFNIIFPALQNIHRALREKSMAENSWPWDT